METPIQVEPQKSNTGLIIGIGGIVVALLCCCVVFMIVGIAAVTIMGPLVGKVYSTIDDNLTPMPVQPFVPATPDLSGVPTIPSDLIPQGGKGDEIQRASAWAYVITAAATDGCSYNPKAASTTIKVTQEADAKGVWKEVWTMTCDDGSKKPYTVTFTPAAGGSTDITVTSGGQ